jgi:putative transposase
MEQILTVVCKLQPTEEQRQHLADTLQAFADACQYLHDTVDPTLTNRARMQTLGYRDTRVRFGLSANLAIRAIARVAANRRPPVSEA